MTVTMKTTRSTFIPLRDAMLCVDCEFITPAGSDTCSICGRQKLVGLAELLEVLIGKACDTTPPTAITEIAQLVPLTKQRSSRTTAQKAT
jgi:hypothetical protein